MNYFVFYQYEYDGSGLEEFVSEQEMLSWLDERASQFVKFKVVRGSLVKLAPVEIVKKWAIA